MRMKGYTADSMMKNKDQLAEVAKYMSPMVVYESAHQSQAIWAKKSGAYKPHMQEDEIEAMSLEGLYSSEKMTKDPAFKDIMDKSRDFSSYATKRVDILRNTKIMVQKNSPALCASATLPVCPPWTLRLRRCWAQSATN